MSIKIHVKRCEQHIYLWYQIVYVHTHLMCASKNVVSVLKNIKKKFNILAGEKGCPS